MALVHRHVRGVVIAAALAGAAVAAWISVQGIPRSLTWPALFMSALQLCLTASTVAAVTAFCVHETIRRAAGLRIGLPVEQSVQRAAISGLWVPPLLILLRRESPWALVPAILLAAVLHRLWSRTSPVAFPGDSRMSHSVAVAALAQFSLAATLAGRMVWACAACVCAALLLWGRTWRPTRKPRPLRQSLTPSRRVLAMSLTAALLTVAGLTHFLRPGFGFGEGSLMATLFGNGTAGKRGQRTGPARDPKRFTSDDLSPSHRAVILYPEKKAGVIGLIPPLPRMRAELGGIRRDENLRIPFFGVYWVLRQPDRQPPPGAITMRGNPAFQSFRSNDSVPLTMEARQNLGVMVNSRCCEAIEVAILNADKYQHTVRLELLLRNTALPGKPTVSLGILPVLSEARFRFQPGIVVEETISFPVPRSLALEEFDELQIRFETAALRADRSPRISIESFRLVPRRSS